MYHISANLAFSRAKKIFGVQKGPGGQEAYKEKPKKTVKNLWGGKK